MSKAFTISDLNETYENLKNAYSSHTLDTHRRLIDSTALGGIAMNETENTDVANKFLNTKLELRDQIDKAQEETRNALKLACDSGSAQILMDLAIAISTIDKVWKINQEQVEEFQQAVNTQNEVTYNPTTRHLYVENKTTE